MAAERSERRPEADRCSAALAALVGDGAVLTGEAVRPYLQDATEAQGLRGHADAVVLPSTTEEVAAVLAYTYEHGIAVTARGGGTGYAGGCVPTGGVVVATERLNQVRSFDPLLWRAEVEAGVTTRTVQRLARENGLYFPVDPGASEQSAIGGNVATNAGGPHTFKYGVMRSWVTGIEAVVPPGEIVRLGGATRKDVAGYDLVSLLAGSEGTLALITSVSLRFLPAIKARFPIAAYFADLRAGCEAIEAVMASGCVPAAIEYLDRAAIEIAAPPFPAAVPVGSELMLLVEADGSGEEARSARAEILESLDELATSTYSPEDTRGIDALWRWREGIGIAVDGAIGGKVSEDIAVPVDRLADAIEATQEIGLRHGLRACSWGHAGDGNLHSTFLVDRTDAGDLRSADGAAEDLFALAARLGGTISGEHGLGLVKSGHLGDMWDPVAVHLHEQVKTVFDPKNLLNPGKKVA